MKLPTVGTPCGSDQLKVAYYEVFSPLGVMFIISFIKSLLTDLHQVAQIWWSPNGQNENFGLKLV